LVESEADAGLTDTEDSVTELVPEGEMMERVLASWSLT
jgi:hypothetical protein